MTFMPFGRKFAKHFAAAMASAFAATESCGRPGASGAPGRGGDAGRRRAVVPGAEARHQSPAGGAPAALFDRGWLRPPRTPPADAPHRSPAAAEPEKPVAPA